MFYWNFLARLVLDGALELCAKLRKIAITNFTKGREEIKFHNSHSKVAISDEFK